MNTIVRMILLLILCCLSLFLIYYENKVEIPSVRLGVKEPVMFDNSIKDNVLCKVPKLSLEDDKLKDKFYKMPPLNCTGDNLLYMSDDNGYMSINETVLLGRKINHCKYYVIEWKNDYFSKLSEPIIRTEEPFAIKIHHDFFKVECHLESGNTQLKQEYVQYFAHIGSTEQAVKRIKEKNKKQNNSKEQMNILMFTLDSMSHLAYQRKLPKTYNYLKNTLGAIILNDYNIVAQGTLGAMLPILTGRSREELPDVRQKSLKHLEVYDVEVVKKNISTIDVFPWIWKQYKEHGYVTLMAEDVARSAKWGNFVHNFNGFARKPTDHYLRTFWLAAEKLNYCCGNRPQHLYQLDYVKHFFKEYKHVPKFAYSFLEKLSHDNINPVEYLDTDLMEFLRSLKQNGNLDNTVFMLMSDHGSGFGGHRRSDQGKLEYRLPLMSFLFPDWFQEKYPKYYSNLQKNAHRLATPFDVHETLLDLLDLSRLQALDLLDLSRLQALDLLDLSRLQALDLLDLSRLQALDLLDLSRLQALDLLDLSRLQALDLLDLSRLQAQDLLDLSRLQAPAPDNPRAMSLLQEIPVDRTCDSADISTRWCSCVNQLEVNNGHQLITKAANVMVDHIRSFISDHLDLCENLSLKQVNDAKIIIEDEQLLKKLLGLDVNQRMNYASEQFTVQIFQIMLTTSPSNGMYEGTLTYKTHAQKWSVIGELSRVNKYGDQPSCIEETHPDLAKYCYCRKQGLEANN